MDDNDVDTVSYVWPLDLDNVPGEMRLFKGEAGTALAQLGCIPGFAGARAWLMTLLGRGGREYGGIENE